MYGADVDKQTQVAEERLADAPEGLYDAGDALANLQPYSGKAAVMVPTTGKLTQGLVNWLFRQGLNSENKIGVKVIRHTRPGFVEDVRQCLLDGFLNQLACEWAVFVDSDTTPNRDVLDVIEAAEKAEIKIVTGLVPFHGKQPGVHANVFLRVPEGLLSVPWHYVPWDVVKRGGRFWEVQNAGMACVFVHRSVLEKLMGEARAGRMAFPFRAIWHEGRVRVSEDMAFFLRCEKLGFKIWADLWNDCAHEKAEVMYARMVKQDAAFFSPGETQHPDAPGGEVEEPYFPYLPKQW